MTDKVRNVILVSLLCILQTVLICFVPNNIIIYVSLIVVVNNLFIQLWILYRFKDRNYGTLISVSKESLKKLLDNDAHWSTQSLHLQTHNTDLLEEVRIYRKLSLTEDQQKFVNDQMLLLKKP